MLKNLTMNNQPKIAIVTINKNVYSETFIKAQIDFLPASLVLYGDWFPTHYGKDRIIQSRKKKIISRALYFLFHVKLFTKEQELIRILKKNNIQVVIAQYGIAGVYLNKLCKDNQIPLIVHFHGFDASKQDILSHYKEGYLKMFNDAKSIISVSKSMYQKLISLGCSESKLKLIHYGPNDKFLLNKPKYDTQTFFSIGRFVDKKAPYLTILAFYLVQQEFCNAKLIMAGNGELLGLCKNLARSLKLENNIEFLGVISPDQTRIYMEKSIAYVQHSIVAESGDSEGTPLAILEAQAAALPVISTNHAGIPDVVINNVTGFLVEETDVQGMKEAMKKILINNELARELGEKGRLRIIENFTMKHYLSKLNHVIQSAI